MQRWHGHVLLGAMLGVGMLAGPAMTTAAEQPVFAVRAAQGRFEPAELAVPAGTPFRLKITNAEKHVIEFESFELHRERVVQPGQTITVIMPSVGTGTYTFVDDLHRSTPEGAIVAK